MNNGNGSSSDRTARQVPNIKIKAEVIRLLGQHVTKLENGFAKYERGWGDDRIALETGCSRSSVSYMRSQLYGKTKQPHTNKRITRADRALLEQVVAKFNALCDALDAKDHKIDT